MADETVQLEQLAAMERELQTTEAAIAGAIAEKILDGDTSDLEAKHAGIMARLRAIPLRRQALENQRAEKAHQAALADLERLSKRVYETNVEIAQIGAQIARTTKKLDDLNAKRQALVSEIDELQRAQWKKVSQGEITQQDLKESGSVWQYIDPAYPNYENVMRRRAARGHLPPGVTLADLGISEQE